MEYLFILTFGAFIAMLSWSDPCSQFMGVPN